MSMKTYLPTILQIFCIYILLYTYTNNNFLYCNSIVLKPINARNSNKQLYNLDEILQTKEKLGKYLKENS